MLELVTLLWVSIAAFAAIGLGRGWTKEVIALAGITLGLFALHQFDESIRQGLLGQVPAQSKFFAQTTLFLLIVFFAYQTRALMTGGISETTEAGGRNPAQSKILGGLVGAVNGYLIGGSVWYFMHINDYPLAPYIEAPAPGSLSHSTVGNLPLYVLAGGPGAPADLLTLLVIILFVVVLILI